MKIGVNGIYLSSNATGIANVIINFVNELSKNHEIIIFTCFPLSNDCRERLNSNSTIITKPNPIRANSIIWFFTLFPFLLNKNKCDWVYSPAVWTPFFISKKIKKLVQVNDFVSIDYKNTMLFWNRIISSLIEKHSLKNADIIWTISEYTKNKMFEYYPFTKTKTIFTGLSCDPYFTRKSFSKDTILTLKKRLGITKPFLFFVGSKEPRKNISFLLKVFKTFHKTNNFQLVLSGISGWGKTGIDEILEEKDFPNGDIIFTGFITEEELCCLYHVADCFISTSFNEGFGLPQLEAMKCGCPVITSHNSAMIEVVENAGITVDGWDIQSWCNKLQTVLNNKNSIIERQYKKADNFAWNNIIIGLEKLLAK